MDTARVLDIGIADAPAGRRGRPLHHTLRRLGVGLCVMAYFAASPFGYAVFAVWSAWPFCDPDARARRMRVVVSRAFRAMHAVLRWTRIVDFDPDDHAASIPPGPCVLVANHPTLMDISALLAADANLVYPVKPRLFNAFWAWPLFRRSGHFEGAGRDPLRVAHMIQVATERLAAGHRVILFPEGTRSPDRGLHPFGRAAFEIAQRARVPIVPLAITCEPRFLGKSSGFRRPPGELPRLRIHVLEPLDPTRADLAGSSSRRLRDIVVARIRAALDGIEGEPSLECAR